MTGTLLMETAIIPRPETQAAYARSVKRVIIAMRENLCEPLSLEDMAEIAYLSPYHFNRVFRMITGIPPAQFLYALRLEQAKRLLVNTDMSVTDTCFETGYNSLGSFTTRFTKLVGVSPNKFRRLIRELGGFRLNMVRSMVEQMHDTRKSFAGLQVQGRIHVPVGFSGLIFAGLFHRPIPEAHPVACTLLAWPGTYSLAVQNQRRHFVFSVALSWSTSIHDLLTLDGALRGRSGELHAASTAITGDADVRLSPRNVVHPPILAAMPLLVARRLALPLPLRCDGQKLFDA